MVSKLEGSVISSLPPLRQEDRTWRTAYPQSQTQDVERKCPPLESGSLMAPHSREDSWAATDYRYGLQRERGREGQGGNETCLVFPVGPGQSRWLSRLSADGLQADYEGT